LWDILGGFIDAGETAEEAVCREILEETGLRVRITRYLGSFPDTYGPRQVPTLNLGFVTLVTSGALHPATDVAEVRWFAATELPRVWAFPHQPKVIEAWRGALP
jgi:NADH pyrophosphatase NudC (nudix superfamily)